VAQGVRDQPRHEVGLLGEPGEVFLVAAADDQLEFSNTEIILEPVRNADKWLGNMQVGMLHCINLLPISRR
jgi:hypothetical protein